MIVIGKDKTLDNYFIDENGVITDLNGEIQKLIIHQGRYDFKGIGVHKIQMWTNFGWRDTKVWVIHHIDENPLNNSLSNLVFLTKSKHISLHNKGKKLSEETKRKVSINHFDFSGKNNPMFGRTHSEEAKKKISLKNKGKLHSEEAKKKMSIAKKGVIISEITKQKISEKIKGRIWVNNGIENKMVFSDNVPNGFIKGMMKKKE